MIHFRPTISREAIAALDAVCFPVDAPPVFDGASWTIGWHGDDPACYCAWKMARQGDAVTGFHYRAGVLQNYRGRGLQREMIRLREASMRSAGLEVAVTYADADCAASINSMIGEGYRAYEPTNATCLSGWGRLGRCGFVHLRKSL